jgi:hypothetical protein
MLRFVFIRNLVPGLFESVYEVVMDYELKKSGMIAETPEAHADHLRQRPV